MSSSSPSSSFTLYRDTPHIGHMQSFKLFFYTIYNHLDKHVFSSTPYPFDTISYLPHSYWSEMYYFLDVFHATTQAIQ